MSQGLSTSSNHSAVSATDEMALSVNEYLKNNI